MKKSHALIVFFTSIALITSSTITLANPGNGKGNSANAHKAHGHKNFDKNNDHSLINIDMGSPQITIDTGGIRITIGDNKAYWGNVDALPPGIQKRLAQGKPLPPGIAKKLDNRLIAKLPHYEGYEWMRAGKDLLLVVAATGIIYDVLHDVFD
ncbi:RcnB family protein [Entomomonas sp. E2T0]|uniref:RcnB family protein n=1 Tax=Entomomonas sp. E2T0 TaxID=2930213 RepID=UPI0022283DC6|nr:RcnB family protein [Entomomonas sp. E2T0]UYZ84848.1 RcnB family protein [Entomomonas sp. E2T0]